MPKKVELGQRKVTTFPEESSLYRDLRRAAAARAEALIGESLQAALAEGSTSAVVRPSEDAFALAASVSQSLGPPRSFQNEVPASFLARWLAQEQARYGESVETFRRRNNQDIGKKIEGTGFLQVGYFSWVGGGLLILALVYLGGRIALGAVAASNPVVGGALGAVKVGAGVVGKMFRQVVKGGENFKAEVDRLVADEKLRAEIKAAFRAQQMSAQDEQTQVLVRKLTE